MSQALKLETGGMPHPTIETADVTERIVLRLDSAPGAPDALDAQEAFAQLRDLFQLATASHSPGGRIFWRLVSVSMNSPLTVVAEAAPVDTTSIFDIDEVARATKTAFAANMGELASGRIPTDWETSPDIRKVAHEVLVRASVAELPEARITLWLEESLGAAAAPILDRQIAVNALALIDAPANDEPRAAKKQYGSVEGITVSVLTHRRKPAIRIRERTRGHEITCLVTDEHRAEFDRSGSFDDVWRGRRVIVSGLLSYDSSGKPALIVADRIRWLEPQVVDVADIRDPEFTSGLSVTDYLERLREGSLG